MNIIYYSSYADEPLGVYINMNVNDISSISETKMVRISNTVKHAVLL